MATRDEAESQRATLEEPMADGEAPAVFEAPAGDEAPARDEAPAGVCSCFDIGVGIVVFVAIALIVANFFSRDVTLLDFAAAWSFIFLFPLLQVSCCCISFGEPAKDVEYQLSGKVVEEKARQDLKATGLAVADRGDARPALAGVSVDDAAESTAIQTSTTAEEWCETHIDRRWYRLGGFSLWLTIFKALLNIYSVVITPFHYNLFERDRDEPGWLGISWVVSIEFPYMIFFLLPYFVCTAMQARGWWCTSLDPAGKVKAIVRLSGLLKSLARFSALNLLEFIRLDDFIQQHWMQKLMSVIGAVLGFMAFRSKVTEIAFVVDKHASAWTWGQWARVVALINNLLSITDLRNKMIFAELQTKEYRKDRWLEAVVDHLISVYESGEYEFVEASRSWPSFFASLHHWCYVKWCQHLSVEFFALQRLVSMGPDDVTRLIEDLGIDYKKNKKQSSSGVPSATAIEQPGSNQRKKLSIPQHILDDCWNGQLTNVVAVVRFGLFYARTLAKKGQDSDKDPEPLQQGKVRRTLEKQKERLREKAQIQDELRTQKKRTQELETLVRRQVQDMRADEIQQDLQNQMETQLQQMEELKKKHEDLEAKKMRLLQELTELNDSADAKIKELREGDMVKANQEFKTNNERSFVILKGTVGKIIQIDSSGDAEIDFGGYHDFAWLFQDRLHYLTKACPTSHIRQSLTKTLPCRIR